MAELIPFAADCFNRNRKILAGARAEAMKSVNAAMVAAYWHIGREIVEEEQRGRERADYGSRLIKSLSERLTEEFGPGFSAESLKHIRRFYLIYRDRTPAIGYTVCTQFDCSRNPFSGERLQIQKPERTDGTPLSSEISWSHYRILMRVSNPEARSFYEIECIKSGWSVRELQRQIGSLLFDRLIRSRDVEGVLALAREGQVVQTPADLIKDPYVLEFVGLQETSHFRETDLERALINRLQQFLLELGRDLFFVSRQKRITVDGDHFYIDLVFYHRILRCFLLIDLKLGKLSQEDIGQMLLYTGWFENEEMQVGENPPVGLVLCADKNEAMVRYTLSQSANQVFASRFQLHLPSEEQLRVELERERQRIEGG